MSRIEVVETSISTKQCIIFMHRSISVVSFGYGSTLDFLNHLRDYILIHILLSKYVFVYESHCSCEHKF